jgi:hypothetical protein
LFAIEATTQQQNNKRGTGAQTADMARRPNKQQPTKKFRIHRGTVGLDPWLALLKIRAELTVFWRQAANAAVDNL